MLTSKDIDALENLLMLAMLAYRKLSDDGPDQDYLMATAIEPARHAIDTLRRAHE